MSGALSFIPGPVGAGTISIRPIFAVGMAALGYFLALPFIYGIAWLPFPLLYLLSDGLYVLIYHVIGYRKAVVRQNLRNSFPEQVDSGIEGDRT